MNWEQALSALENGTLRCAQKVNGEWMVNSDAKKLILEAFKAGTLAEMNGFVDKHNLPARKFTADMGVRLVPGGTSIRRGAHLAKGVIVMPPSYVNVGAFVDEGSMIDSHVLVGSCAQIGKRVHLSTGVQIGGVLEPIGNAPVIIEDDVFIGACAVIVEGIRVGERAVIAPGVVLSKGVPVYDCVNQKELGRGAPIPPGAVVVPGTRPMSAEHRWGHDLGLNLSCAIIVKYRDAKSDTSLTLEEALR